MRLTLRTLLAYLDDTLPANEIREIGQKVAESDTAQDLISRIKLVTRRRRLTSPPATGPGAKIDPNTIAEYLDNLLTPEQVAEVEGICLESDVHLAEIAACHQILTLVLGQPANVPPTARQRMYGVVHGREAIPSRKAKALLPAEEAAPAQAPDDDALVMGLPHHGKSARWLALVLPLVGIALVGALALTIWKALPPSESSKPVTLANANKKDSTASHSNTPPVNANEKPESTQKDKDAGPKGGDQKPPDKGDKPANTPITPPVNPPKNDTVPSKDPATAGPPKIAPPSTDRQQIGKCVVVQGVTPSLVLHRPANSKEWKAIAPEKEPIFTNETLIALPGNHAGLRTASGVELLLFGNLEEFMEIPPRLEPCLETAVILHANPEFDLDFTLSRGRVYIKNGKADGAAQVRFRFHKETWDFTLKDPGTEIGIDLTGRNTLKSAFQSGHDPRAELFMGVLKGHVTAKIGYKEMEMQAPPGPGALGWDNEGSGVVGPLPVKENLPIWNKSIARTKLASEMKTAVEAMWRGLIDEKKSIEVTLQGFLGSSDPKIRIVSVLDMGALDDVGGLIDALDDQEPMHLDVRQTAIFALSHWIGRGGDQDDKLYDSIKKTGILIDKKFSQAEAEIIMQLLHDLSDEQIHSPETFDALISYLKHRKLPIRELAFSQLWRLVPQGRTIPYNPAEGTDQRDAAYEMWKKLIPTGKLPPPPGQPGIPGIGQPPKNGAK